MRALLISGWAGANIVEVDGGSLGFLRPIGTFTAAETPCFFCKFPASPTSPLAPLSVPYQLSDMQHQHLHNFYAFLPECALHSHGGLPETRFTEDLLEGL